MSDDVVVDAEIVEPMDKPAAERLDKRIRLLVGAIEKNLTKLHALVVQAKSGQIHVALGFKSWTAYVADVFTLQVRLDRPQRRELVGWLSGEGMSQRVIADVVGVDQKTVSNDLRAREEISSPAPRSLFDNDQEAADAFAMAELSDGEFEAALTAARAQDDLSRENVARICRERNEPAPITGRDGKMYQPKQSRPQEPSKPRRKPITTAFWETTYDLTKLTNRLRKLADDDRFSKNRNEIFRNASDLMRAQEVIASVLDQMRTDQVDLLAGGA